MTLEKLFEEDEKIRSAVKDVAECILELSDFTSTNSVMELAQAEVAGKRAQKACDVINEHVHAARELLGKLMTQKTKTKFKGQDRSLHEIENDLSRIHGDADSIGRIAAAFFEAEDRAAAFENLQLHYDELVEHVTALILDETSLKDLPAFKKAA